MNRSPHEAVIVEETGGPLSQQHLHAARVAFLGSQVEHGAACGVLHVHVGCSLCQHAQRLPVSLIGLESAGRSQDCAQRLRNAENGVLKHLQQDAVD